MKKKRSSFSKIFSKDSSVKDKERKKSQRKSSSSSEQDMQTVENGAGAPAAAPLFKTRCVELQRILSQ